MLRKLLKYDIKELLRQTLPLIISMCAVSIVCCVLLYFSMSFGEAEGLFAAFGATMSFFGIGIFALMVLAVAIEFISIIRYYRSLFTDEGYLNMVIPVKTSTLLFAKTLSVVIFNLIGALTLVISLFIGVGLPIILYDIGYINDVKDVIGLFVDVDEGIGGEVALSVIGALVELLYSTVAILSAITVGSVVVRRRKILGSVLFFFAFSFLKSVVESVVALIIEASLPDSATALAYLTAETVTGIILSTLIGAALYLLNLRILERKFNIE